MKVSARPRRGVVGVGDAARAVGRGHDVVVADDRLADAAHQRLRRAAALPCDRPWRQGLTRRAVERLADACPCMICTPVHVGVPSTRVNLRPGVVSRRLLAAQPQARSRPARRWSQAAYSLVRDDGFEGLTAEAVADRAGVSRRTFFNYFPSVESVLTASVTEFFASVGARLEAPPGRRGRARQRPRRGHRPGRRSTSSSGSACSPPPARPPPTPAA